MSKMKPEKSRIKSDILLRVRLLYILFILAGLLIFARLVWVQLFSSEVAYNAERLAGRIFTEQIIPAQRGNILTRDGDPLATSIFRYRVEFASISAARGSTPCVRSTNRATRCPNYLPPISATDPQPNTVACSARSMPNTTR